MYLTKLPLSVHIGLCSVRLICKQKKVQTLDWLIPVWAKMSVSTKSEVRCILGVEISDAIRLSNHLSGLKGEFETDLYRLVQNHDKQV